MYFNDLHDFIENVLKKVLDTFVSSKDFVIFFGILYFFLNIGLTQKSCFSRVLIRPQEIMVQW